MKILNTLHDTNQGCLSYTWKAALVSLIPSLCIAFIVNAVFPAAEEPEFVGPPVLVAASLLIVSPWIETLLLWLGLNLIQRFTEATIRIAVASAVVWAILHSLAAPVWGLCIIWPFYVFSVSFLEWRKVSRWRAVWVTALIHMLQNAIPTIVLLAGSA
jgi:hypothetical protein